MRRAAWIFFASILLPSLVLAWLAVRSVRDQQVVLEHQQAIICQNITDTLAKNIQGQMDGVRADFVQTTEKLLGEKASPRALADSFNRTLSRAWPLAEIGFAVNVNGDIYSPTPYEGPAALRFRDENDRFLSNRENVEVYTSNGAMITQHGATLQVHLPQNVDEQEDIAAMQQEQTKKAADMVFGKALTGAPKLPVAQAPSQHADIVLKNDQGSNGAVDKKASEPVDELQAKLRETDAPASALKDQQKETDEKAAGAARGTMEPTEAKTVNAPGYAGTASAAASGDAEAGAARIAPVAAPAAAPAATTAPALDTDASAMPTVAPTAPVAAAGSTPVERSPIAATTAMPAPMPATPPAPTGGESQTISVPTTTIVTATPPSADLSDSAPVNNLSQNTPQFFSKIARNVVPQQMLQRETASLSNTVPEESDFRRVIGTETSGELARFLEDKMRLLVWMHPGPEAPIVFGAQLDRDKLVETLQTSLSTDAMAGNALDGISRTSDAGFCAAILDDTGHPVALSRPGFVADWKHPFVATEIGEALPHWEAALYLVDPQQFSRAARTLQFSFLFIVVLLIAAILAGGSAIGRDVRREMRLAQQKTDFVSNVSHELKTPLTSIRMFADLLAEKRVPDADKQATYLRIIAAEASRLTRLINNVLDFARLEKGAPHGEHAACDLVEAVRDVADTCEPHLEAAGVTFQCEIEAETLPIRGDRDALAQIILNLISNAEKYGGNDILVRVRRQEIASGALGCVDVLDRGAGIPARQVKTIFEPFHRLDDSLSSGIPGSGLGLTLARRMARVHGGDVTYSARAGGGSCFTLAVPLI